ncbi:MAG: DUF3192 domain-containing protein [Treponema sp.]|uniref:hypothetical protein n=1 Tax=Treponema sp. TaxID=166 RepID=UPI00298EBEC2|nr:hypothetical protein [Treponema sp.]MBR5934514.1 DUF3192 domain-containing protein [Treponema sp.]
MNLKIGTSYKEIIRKFGKPFSIGNSKNGVKIIYMLKDNNSYVLDFNLWFKLCGMTYGLNDTVFYDNRNPIVFKQEKKNNREDIEQLSIGNTLDQVITEFGEPDIKNELFLIYKFDESKCYKLKFTESLKLMELDVWTDYSIRENEYLDGKRIPLFYDSRID